MSAPSMVQFSGDTLVVRSVVSGDKLFGTGGEEPDDPPMSPLMDETDPDSELMRDDDGNLREGPGELPQCKIKRNYACNHCNYYTQNPRFYLFHLKNVHKEKIKIYECPNCLYASKHSQKLQRHVHMVHVMGAGKKKIAKAKQQQQQQLQRSQQQPPVIKRSAPISPPIQPPPPYVEPVKDGGVADVYSSRNFDMEEGKVPELALTAVGGDEKVFKCSLCSFSSRSQILVTRHEKIVHLKKKFFRCVKCNYVTHMKARFTKHVKYHSMPMIKCELCDFRTPYKWNLDRHMKNHQGDGAFKCALCNFTADIKQSLTVHEMNHHEPPVGQAPFGCIKQRRNRVGASDTMAAINEPVSEMDEMELLRLEREGQEESKDPKAFDATRRSQNDNRTEQLLKGRLISNDTSNSNINNNNCIVNNFNDSGNDLIVKKSPVQSSAGGIAKLLARDFATSGPENMVTSKSPTESSTEESVQKFACRVCPFTTLWEVELLRHEHNVHIEGGGKKKAPPRPIPNLIPIQNKPSQPIGSPSTLTVLKVPSVQNTNTPSSQTTSPTSNKISLTNSSSNISNNKLGSSSVSDQELNAYCAQSSSLKDFASLFHDSESGSRNSPEACRKPKSNLNDLSINPSLINKTKDGAGIAVDSKKKNLSFFDTLKEKLMVDAGGDNLICTFCGHESKCLSELVRHQKLHKTCPDQNDNSSTSSTLSAPNNNELFSTRCQHCRQRCKTSTDLIHHLKSCTVAMKKCVDSGAGDSTSVDDPMIPELEEGETNGGKGEGMDIDDAGSEKADSIASEPHPMENKVFVWNNRPEPAQAQNEDMEDAVQDEELKANQDEEGSEGHEDFDDEENDGEGEGEGEEDEDEEDEEDEGEEPIDGNLHGALEGNLEGTLQEVGVETAPGIGSVTYKSKSGCHGLSVPMSESDIGPNAELNIKRAYKCPHCSFWAATASRFHVHIVGHLNKKPFECSLCSYRSNWRWDITKHIRLKTARDPNHHKARVLMTDETGRRNYSKYNKYLTLIRVHEPTAESSGTGRRTKDLPKSTAKSTGNVAPSEQSIARKPTALAPPAVSASPPAVKRPQSSESSESEPPKKKSSPENKKTMWKCKKCLFRDSDRTVVLAHVKEHYKQAEVEKNAKNAQQDGNGNSTGCKTANQDQKQSEITISRKENTSNDLQDTDFRNAEIRVHSASHEKMANPTIKCYYCPFYVTSQEELIDHIQHVHGNDNDANGIPANNNSTVSSPRSFDEEEEPGTHETYSSLVTKRYKCANCPYVSNSKSQFLYHRQFHRPRGASFKCNICSYNVTRRHLLHQHLRVHGITVSESVYGKNLPYEEYEEILESPGDISKTDTTAFSEIPLVWVSKLGTLTKMFKCRYCPHVNIRKSNIQEHEKMHSAREIKAKENGSPSIPLTSHHCTECNYICNNAGVLSSHTKVHQGLFGQVCALYDASRCDEEQIKEINMMLNQGLIHPGTEKLQSPPNGFINNFNHLNSNTINEDLSNRTDNSQDLLNKSFDNPENSILLEADGKILHFCSLCPARFLYVKELEIHSRFHALKLSHQCESCSYTARQHPHLLAHYKVHTDDYQERTSALCVTYGISPHHPRPRTAVILDGTSNSNYAWVVVNASNKTILEGGHFDQTMDKAEGFMKKPDAMNMKPFKGLQKHYSCDKCPAKFFKSVALQYHLTLHGGSGAHKCRSCDYAVKTYGNLIKHETIHNLEPREKYSSKYGRLMAKSSANNIPMSGTDLFKQKNEALQKIITNGDSGSTCGSPPAQLPVDPEFGVLMHGSPEFTYPTYLKNGRLKEKRYKCHKCPSAFDKREQYKVHLSLHGAKQKYRCERCDYSVKYYANYLQHMKKHDSSDSSRTTERKSVSDKSESDYISDNVSESAELQSDDGRESQTKSHAAKSLKLSMADQQAIMLMQLKEKNLSSSPPETVVRCPFCPYSNLRKEQVNHHLNRHSSIKVGTYACKHCDYSVLQTNYSREHNKLHFQQMKGMKPDAYMKCDRIELWSQPADNPNPNDKVLIFQDRGAVNTVNRFQPIVNEELSENQELEKIYVNINTGEEEDLIASKENCDKENDEKLCNGVSKESSPSSNSIPVKENSVDVKVEAPAQESTANVRGRLCPISGTFIAASDDDNDEPDEDFKGYPPNDEDSNTSNSANSKNESDCVTDTAS